MGVPVTVTVHFRRMKLVCLLVAVLVGAAPASAIEELIGAGRQLAEKVTLDSLGVFRLAADVVSASGGMFADLFVTMDRIAEPVMNIGEHVLEIGEPAMDIGKHVLKIGGAVMDLINMS